jgi:glycosyltransferase involved in cell wall biosynthesis
MSSSKEQHKGLLRQLRNQGLKCYTTDGFDLMSVRKALSAARRVGMIIEDEKIDVIHAQGIRHLVIAFIATRFFSRRNRQAIVVNVHSTLHGRRFENIIPIIESIFLNLCADLVIPVSKSTARRLFSSGLLPRKTLPVYNGVDLPCFDLATCGHEYSFSLPSGIESSPSFVIGYSARMVQHKGHEYLIKAVSEIADELPSIALVITGDGPLRSNLIDLVEDLGLEDVVLFTGQIRYKALYQLLKRIDIYVHPSLAELFPFAILEAMAAGKPVVAANVGGVSEAVIDGMNGYLVPPRDSTSLAKAILRLMNSPDMAREMGLNGRRLVERRFSLKVISHKLSKVYELALKLKRNS